MVMLQRSVMVTRPLRYGPPRNVRLPADLDKAVRAYARAHGATWSAIVRLAVTAFLKGRP